jgi:hypothetical protein
LSQATHAPSVSAATDLTMYHQRFVRIPRLANLRHDDTLRAKLELLKIGCATG